MAYALVVPCQQTFSMSNGTRQDGMGWEPSRDEIQLEKINIEINSHSFWDPFLIFLDSFPSFCLLCRSPKTLMTMTMPMPFHIDLKLWLN